jgi:hypothetical protein
MATNDHPEIPGVHRGGTIPDPIPKPGYPPVPRDITMRSLPFYLSPDARSLHGPRWIEDFTDVQYLEDYADRELQKELLEALPEIVDRVSRIVSRKSDVVWSMLPSEVAKVLRSAQSTNASQPSSGELSSEEQAFRDGQTQGDVVFLDRNGKPVKVHQPSSSPRLNQAAAPTEDAFKPLTGAERDILQTLAESKTRLTRDRLMEAMEQAGRSYGESTLRNALPDLRRAELVDNRQDCESKGYAITPKGRALLK